MDRGSFVLDVSEMEKEIWASVMRWIGGIEANPNGEAARNVEANLKTLVEVRQFTMAVPVAPIPGLPPIHVSTINVTRSS